MDDLFFTILILILLALFISEDCIKYYDDSKYKNKLFVTVFSYIFIVGLFVYSLYKRLWIIACISIIFFLEHVLQDVYKYNLSKTQHLATFLIELSVAVYAIAKHEYVIAIGLFYACLIHLVAYFRVESKHYRIPHPINARQGS